MTKSREEYLDIAKIVAGQAGKFLKSRFGGIKEMSEKETGHFEIPEDKQTNEIYEKYLKKVTPEIGLYSEESERNLTQDLTWVIDPIEGTSNYRIGVPFFATQICLVEKGELVVAVINAVCTDNMYWAIKGKGAFQNNSSIKIGKERLNRGLVAVERGWGNNFANEAVKQFGGRSRTIRWYGATGLSMAFTAAGGIDLYLNKGSNLYDYAPGVLLVRESGGVVWNLAGEEWNINSREVIAGNREIVEEGLEVLRS